MKMLIAAATLLMLPATALSQSAPAKTAPASEPMTVYDKALSPGWENWSWAKTELSADIGSARMPIMVDAQGYGGMFLHHAPFSTAPYKTLNLLIQVVGGPAQVRVIATANGKGIPNGDKMEGGQPVTKMKLVKLAPGGWTQVQVPLVNLGAENATIDGLMVMNDSGEPAPHIYVADITFKP